MTVTNTIVADASMGGFVDSDGAMIQRSNLSSDQTAAGPGAITGVNESALFLSTTTDAEDLHLRPGATAIDRGTDLGAELTLDIDDQPRPSGAAWDIGADER